MQQKRDLCGLILHFKICHVFSVGGQSGLQAGQSSAGTQEKSHFFVMQAECVLLLKYYIYAVPEKDVALKAACIASESLGSFQH